MLILLVNVVYLAYVPWEEGVGHITVEYVQALVALGDAW